jgi:hypothetical protein
MVDAITEYGATFQVQGLNINRICVDAGSDFFRGVQAISCEAQHKLIFSSTKDKQDNNHLAC